ncbi:EAL domain-containing protein [Hyphomicrobium sp. CS1GBMeth3]|uniref:EAL domain-containing protein n=1 Tax=Hyphomicrobium sp. CS1GBMeth3 TaxID=1892845 RepID=UPI00093140D9|nr:EAL domain-containing protein [Hyphomicrobium sp. CS1GBMeth3]
MSDREPAAFSRTWLLEALDENRFVLFLQPVVTALSRKVAFYEALLRLKLPDGMLVSAGTFIEDAEALGLVGQLDRRALELGAALLAADPMLKLAVNISSLTAGDDDWSAALQRLAAGCSDIHSRLIVEVTETATIRDFDVARAFFDRLRALGCRIALDDFGAGNTSLRHLRVLNLDILKIDAALLAGLPDDPRARALAKSVIDMAEGLGLETVAEWGGDEAGASFLEAAGVTYLQGFLFGAPVSVEELKSNGRI